ncbi:MAG: hypothetical protein ABL977_05825 [Candidatus Eisenbacteria bacterium]
MNRDLGAWISPLVALAVLGVTVVLTLGALGVTGAFGWRTAVPRSAVPPAYQAVERALDRHDPHFTLQDLRDPFQPGRPDFDGDGDDPPPAPRPKVVVPVPVVLPVLTAIVYDTDPRALVRWQGREWTVRAGGLFDEFQVVSITREQVTLRRGTEDLVLTRRNPGE